MGHLNSFSASGGGNLDWYIKDHKGGGHKGGTANVRVVFVELQPGVRVTKS